jgi:hypothetical protein
MIFYAQSSGAWASSDGTVLAVGCLAGNNLIAKDMNNPLSQCLSNRGPLPRGVYGIGPLGYQEAVHSQGCKLTPAPTNEMCGRSGFYLHLRNPAHIAFDGTNASSDGCITFPTFAALQAVALFAQKDESLVTVSASLPNLGDPSTGETA